MRERKSRSRLHRTFARILLGVAAVLVFLWVLDALNFTQRGLQIAAMLAALGFAFVGVYTLWSMTDPEVESYVVANNQWMSVQVGNIALLLSVLKLLLAPSETTYSMLSIMYYLFLAVMYLYFLVLTTKEAVDSWENSS